MQRLFRLSCLIILALFGLSGCTAIKQTCLFGGCYGPFELVLEAENGEKVEDVVVNLAHITAGAFEGLTRTYYETKLVNTGEIVTFPRGYMYDSEEKLLSIGITVTHYAYQHKGSYLIDFPNRPQGRISLDTQLLTPKIDLEKKSFAKNIPLLQEKGLTSAEVEQKRADLITNWDPLRHSFNYFVEVAVIDREDIVDKYLPGFIQRHLAIDKGEQQTAEEIEKEYRMEIKQRTDRR